MLLILTIFGIFAENRTNEKQTYLYFWQNVRYGKRRLPEEVQQCREIS